MRNKILAFRNQIPRFGKRVHLQQSSEFRVPIITPKENEFKLIGIFSYSAGTFVTEPQEMLLKFEITRKLKPISKVASKAIGRSDI
jgi:hypothetical protein